MIQSPLNYTGGKFKLLSQILPLFPEKIERFFDVFCGGCNVGINIDCEEVIFIDNNENLIRMYQTFQKLDKEKLLNLIYGIISEYGLSLVSRNGYEFYGCDSSAGLSNYNREPFNRLREDFNRGTIFDFRYYAMLYVLIVYAFNNQLRFNLAGKFNLPVGKRDFNSCMCSKLLAFLRKIQSQNYKFFCQDFREIKIRNFSENDFVYVDPPYLITCATYNETGGWRDADEKDLLDFLDKLHSKKIRFALSNVLCTKGKENKILLNWLNKNSHYTPLYLQVNYSNSNYHKIDKVSASTEVLIVNYEIKKKQGEFIWD